MTDVERLVREALEPTYRGQPLNPLVLSFAPEADLRNVRHLAPGVIDKALQIRASALK